CTALAYATWCADKFLCDASTPALAWLALHGWWHLFIGLSFYYLITLCRYFSGHEYGFEPVLEQVPDRGPIQLAFVDWQPPRARPPTSARAPLLLGLRHEQGDLARGLGLVFLVGREGRDRQLPEPCALLVVCDLAHLHRLGDGEIAELDLRVRTQVVDPDGVL